jgi:hypothetical protein
MNEVQHAHTSNSRATVVKKNLILLRTVSRLDLNESMTLSPQAPDSGCYPPANFFLATGRAKAFVGPCPLFAITLL